MRYVRRPRRLYCTHTGVVELGTGQGQQGVFHGDLLQVQRADAVVRRLHALDHVVRARLDVVGAEVPPRCPVDTIVVVVVVVVVVVSPLGDAPTGHLHTAVLQSHLGG